MKEIKAVIFDMDGLMFDTERIAAEGWKRAGEAEGFDIGEEKLRQMRGRTADAGRSLFKKWYGDETLYDRGRALRTAYLKEYIQQYGTPVKPGLIKLFSYLKKHHYLKAIATSSSRETALWYFKCANIPFDFDQSVCGLEISHGKPAPDIFLKAVQKLGLLPEECLVLEDSISGVHAAVSAGCTVVMIPDLTPADDKMQKLCYHVCRDLEEVITDVLRPASHNLQVNF